MKKTVEIIKKIIAICIDLFLLVMVWFFSLISPYYEWDTTLSLGDPDKTLVLGLIWAILSVLTVLITIIKWKTKIHVLNDKKRQYYSFAFGGLIVGYCVYKLIQVLTITTIYMDSLYL